MAIILEDFLAAFENSRRLRIRIGLAAIVPCLQLATGMFLANRITFPEPYMPLGAPLRQYVLVVTLGIAILTGFTMLRMAAAEFGRIRSQMQST